MNQLRKSLLVIGLVAAYGVIAWLIEECRVRRPIFYAKGWLALIAASLIALLLLLTFHFAHARDLGQWGAINNDPAIREWYQGLMQPDAPNASCCGEADAYWCDDYYARAGKAYCRITDDRPDEPRMRPHREIGAEFEIPNNKLKYDRSNPTGHGVIFISRGDYVYCFVAPGGV